MDVEVKGWSFSATGESLVVSVTNNGAVIAKRFKGIKSRGVVSLNLSRSQYQELRSLISEVSEGMNNA